MNPISAVKKYYYSKITKTSEQQFKDDFFEYPPAPLKKAALTGDFDIIKTRGPGNAFNQLNSAIALNKASEHEIDPDVYDKFQLKILRSTVSTLEQWKILHKLSSIFLCSAIFYALMHANRKPSIKGIFQPLFKNERKITIKVRHGDSDACLTPIISHEHIHLIQHKSAHAPRKHLKNPECIITEKMRDDPFTNYLFQGREIEARLHEVVVSYYRHNRLLPLTINGFIDLLAGSEKLTEFLILPPERYDDDAISNVIKYPDRDPGLTEQLDFTILYTKNELRSRFVNEVLPVMYENLIRYYGDDEAADRFGSQIPRPNLYDEIYGQHQSAQSHCNTNLISIET